MVAVASKTGRGVTNRGQAFGYDYLASRLPHRSFCPVRKCASVLVLAPPRNQAEGAGSPLANLSRHGP